MALKSPISATRLQSLFGSSSCKILDVRGQWSDPSGPLEDDYRNRIFQAPYFVTERMEGYERLGLASVGDAAEVKASFNRLGIQKDDRVVASCGSGYSAAIVMLAMEKANGKVIPMFEGSVALWRHDLERPMEQSGNKITSASTSGPLPGI